MEFTVLQGSWQPETKYSGISHTGAGACDLWLPRFDDEKWRNYVTRVIRNIGCQATWARGPWTPNMPYHWHTLDLDTTGMAGTDTYGGTWQVSEYRAKGGPNDGLTAGKPDRNPYRPSPIRKWKFKEIA